MKSTCSRNKKPNSNQNFSFLIKEIHNKNFAAGGNCGTLALALAREISNKDKSILFCCENKLNQLDDLLDDVSPVYHMGLKVDEHIYDYRGEISEDNLVSFCIDEHDAIPEITVFPYSKENDNLFKSIIENKTDYKTSVEEYQQLYQMLIKELKKGNKKR